MKANELRIGNLILHHNHKIKESFDECIVWMVSEDHLRVRVNDLHNEVVSADYCSGIPLTEEWLLKFGLEEDKGLWYSKIPIFINRSGEVYFGEVLDIDAPIITKSKYVHQLQNLYFALTGEELHL